MPPKPDFFIIGAPKCGTTSLARYLSEHPRVYMTPKKEPNYFNRDHWFAKNTGREDYYALFEGASEVHRRIGEATVWYLYSDVAVQNILKEIDDPKFIVMLRNPVEMMVSLHNQLLFSGYETEEDFGRAWHLQSGRKKGAHIPLSCVEPKVLYYGEVGKLGAQMERLYDNAGKENVKAVRFDRFAANTQEEYHRVLDFLDLEHHEPEFTVHNVARKRRWYGLTRMNNFLNRMIDRWHLPRPGTGIRNYIERFNQAKKEKTTISRSMEMELKEYFREDVILLGRLIDEDLSDWVR